MTQQNIHTLLVTGERQWPSSLYGHLRQKGFAPLFVTPTGEGALDICCRNSPRLVLIDPCLVDYSGVDLCHALLAIQPALKIVLVTEHDEQLPLATLYAGISGCINYALPPAEWTGILTYIMQGGVAFSRTVIETLLAQNWTPQKRDPIMAIGALQINLAYRQVLVAGRRIQLTPREFTLLTCLARNVDHVVTFDQLLNDAWGYHANDGTPAQVRLYIARLRHKLVTDKKLPAFILTERGVGYRLYSGVLRRINAQAPFAQTNSSPYLAAALTG